MNARECTLRPIPVVEVPSLEQVQSDAKQEQCLFEEQHKLEDEVCSLSCSIKEEGCNVKSLIDENAHIEELASLGALKIEKEELNKDLRTSLIFQQG